VYQDSISSYIPGFALERMREVSLTIPDIAVYNTKVASDLSPKAKSEYSAAKLLCNPYTQTVVSYIPVTTRAFLSTSSAHVRERNRGSEDIETHAVVAVWWVSPCLGKYL